jgi:2'-5' RNA ligase
VIPTSGTTRRLFFALWPGADTRRALVRSTQGAVQRVGGRAVPPHNYHITLAFLGNQPSDIFDEIVAAGRRVSMPPITLWLDSFDCWPRPMVFWFGPLTAPQALSRLSADLWTRMEPLGVARDKRDLRPHVTLARKVQVLPELEVPNPVAWPISAFTLIESISGDPGPEYSVVAKFPLGSPHDP